MRTAIMILAALLLAAPIHAESDPVAESGVTAERSGIICCLFALHFAEYLFNLAIEWVILIYNLIAYGFLEPIATMLLTLLSGASRIIGGAESCIDLCYEVWMMPVDLLMRACAALGFL